MRIVLDTNVLVSGLLSPYGPPGELVRMAAAGRLILCHDARILAEYREVLARPKFGFDREHVDAVLVQIHAAGEAVAAGPLPRRLPDPDDEPFLEVALAAGAACLVTGNLRHFPAAARSGMRVVSPAWCVERIRRER
ncbi:MAG: putative toxin-antitoxin system toxin component, PIN family [Planctomycetes bacterium]|nr:putative toxin-antitoxin system toxin component, PIN family [Planctomycetota bacterium]